MNNYVIVTDCTADLNLDIIKKYKIEVIPMQVTMGNKQFKHYADFRELSFNDFYQALREGEMASTSQINPNAYIEFFTPILEKGKDILYICFSSGLSSTYQSLQIALDELNETFKDNKVLGIDSLAASAGEGLMTYYACINREKGMTIEQNYEWIEANKLKFAHWFTVDDLNHLYRGGRVSKTTAMVGGALNIKPVLHVDDEGHLINVGKTHGRKKSIVALLNQLKETGIDIENQTVFISHGDCLDEAEFLKNKVISELHVKEVIISEIGPVVGAHSGPGTLTLMFFATHR